MIATQLPWPQLLPVPSRPTGSEPPAWRWSAEEAGIWVKGRMHGQLVGAGKDAPQPFARLGHRGAGFIDDADPEHEAVIDTVVTSQCGG